MFNLASLRRFSVILFICLFVVKDRIIFRVDAATEESSDSVDNNAGVESTNDERETTEASITSVPPQKIPGVVFLNDNNFEHLTQASTGQTTGSWLVYFFMDTDPNRMIGPSPDPNVWLEEYHTTIAAMNVIPISKTSSKQVKALSGFETYRRFHLKTLPVFLFIHRGKVYNVPRVTSSSKISTKYSWDEIVNFIQNPDAVETGYSVPKPPSLWKLLKKKLRTDMYLSALVAVGTITLISIIIGLCYYLFSQSGNQTKQTKQKKM